MYIFLYKFGESVWLPLSKSRWNMHGKNKFILVFVYRKLLVIIWEAKRIELTENNLHQNREICFPWYLLFPTVIFPSFGELLLKEDPNFQILITNIKCYVYFWAWLLSGGCHLQGIITCNSGRSRRGARGAPPPLPPPLWAKICKVWRPANFSGLHLINRSGSATV